MAAVRPQANGTHELLERIYRGELGASLRARMRRRHFSRSAEEIADAWQEACTIAARACTGKHEGEVYAYLEITMHNLLMRAAERVRGERRLAAVAAGTEVEPAPDEWAGKRELARLVRELVARLPERQQQAWVLHSNGLRKPAIAARLGVTQRAVARDIESGFGRLRKSLVERVGGGCGGPDVELVARHAFGLAKGDQADKARCHLIECPACQAMLVRLDAWREAAAAIVPLPAAERVAPGLLERTTTRLGEGLASLKQHVADTAAGAKQQLSASWYRGVDPTPLSGARPGAAAAAIAGCLAIGGGATYCVQQGVDPITGLRGIVTQTPDKERSEPAAKSRASQQAPDPPPATTPEPQPPAAPADPAPAPEPTPAVTPPAPEDTFEPTHPRAETSTPSAAEPAPAVSNGPGEFTGP